MSLSPTESALAARLLRMASDEFGRHGCSGFDLPNTDENWALVEAVEKRNKTPAMDMPTRPPKGTPIISDGWRLMAYLAHRLDPKGTKP